MTDVAETKPAHDKADGRDLLRAKIEASERRIAERSLAQDAREAATAAADFTRRRPFVVVGGAVFAGLVIGMMTRPGRRIARSTITGAASAASSTAAGAKNVVSKATAKRAAGLSAVLADAIVAYAIKLIDQTFDKARQGQDMLEDMGDSAKAKAREMRRDAGYIAGSTADHSRTASRRANRKVSRAVRDLTGGKAK